ncbi:sigma-54 dependent transcriptional regulator [Rhodanobacter glycinis]|uniref:DNA-binding transcriptional response regulator, NtrC family, contains REC, AAA-type ATPase, and a Fis-type DNA-binding domains n=1 Tax=Rhodanobacter glycinis TaxID=582702 RepID=A0A1I3YS03_9GAMM|nr:sigma-54 dependent transcriptional regulator [Rhodanobacter glycinis]SFK34540.1 DNA-binding transcriptional response regulator, NtrC family, contains REC, AAA-type ATPase, and a Fis-type DNA-binding domains [Rhodanobacter glycinis]
MASKTPQHCVVWFGQPSAGEVDGVAQAGWRVRVTDAQDGNGIGMRHGDIVVAIADLRRCDAEVLPALRNLVADHPWLPWLLLMTDADQVQDPLVQPVLSACTASFTAPFEMKQLSTTLQAIRDGRWAVMMPCVAGLTGHSQAIQLVMASILKYAPVDLPVLITGETGTGKELAACALHQQSSRRERPFAAINCGALPLNLVQSELFGHERGSFTGANARHAGRFEAAAGGTVFLDEVGDLPAEAQTSLLRLLQEGTLERVGSTQPIRPDVRVLAATHVDLEKAVAQGRFREDLYYRLNVLRLRMPALREREDDMELLAQQFLEGFRAQHRCLARGFSRSALQAMRGFAWPGNVRELLNRVQRAAVLAEDALISVADLDLSATDPSPLAGLDRARVEVERETVVACLRASRFNISECARRLKVSRVTVYRLCKKHRLALAEMR